MFPYLGVGLFKSESESSSQKGIDGCLFKTDSAMNICLFNTCTQWLVVESIYLIKSISFWDVLSSYWMKAIVINCP